MIVENTVLYQVETTLRGSKTILTGGRVRQLNPTSELGFENLVFFVAPEKPINPNDSAGLNLMVASMFDFKADRTWGGEIDDDESVHFGTLNWQEEVGRARKHSIRALTLFDRYPELNMPLDSCQSQDLPLVRSISVRAYPSVEIARLATKSPDYDKGSNQSVVTPEGFVLSKLANYLTRDQVRDINVGKSLFPQFSRLQTIANYQYHAHTVTRHQDVTYIVQLNPFAG